MIGPRRLSLAAALLALLVGVLPAGAATPPSQAAAPKWRTTVFARVPAPGYPAHVVVHRNGKVYAASYVDSGSRAPSKVFEWSASGRLLRSWTVPGQVLAADHGVQAANQTRDGKLVLLETSRRAVMTLDPRTGRFRTVARLPAGAVPNFASWGPSSSLFVTDHAQNVIWKIRPKRSGARRVVRWFTSPLLRGVASFGTTGIAFRPGRRDFLVSQQTTPGATPTQGHLLRIPLRRSGRPRAAQVLWTSRPGDLPDGFGLARSGTIYIAMVGLSAQLVQLTAEGREVDRFPDVPLTGDNGSPIPFDNPSNAAFLGTRVLVANQSTLAGNRSNQAILAVEVGERGRPTYLPKQARFGRAKRR